MEGFKVWLSLRNRNGVGILTYREFRKKIVDVRRVNDMMMTIKLVVGKLTLNIISAYTLQADLDEEHKRYFWEDFDKVE